MLNEVKMLLTKAKAVMLPTPSTSLLRGLSLVQLAPAVPGGRGLIPAEEIAQFTSDGCRMLVPAWHVSGLAV